MASFLPLNIVTIIVAFLVTFGFCLQFDDTSDIPNVISDKFTRNLVSFKTKVTSDFAEIQDWQRRMLLIEQHLKEMKLDASEVLSRQRRGLRDFRLGMFVGRPGPPGLPGTPGVPGAMGQRGQKGHNGVAGRPGLRGPPGRFGPPGWPGPRGFIGVIGIKGEKGYSGSDGIPGLIGNVGLVGYNGEHGHMGPPGGRGHVGFIGMIGSPGPRGDPGAVGTMGPPGEQGGIGVLGAVGAYGDPGPMGEMGIMGPPGEMGDKGVKGERGMEGEVGPWGPVGMPGPIYDPYAGFFQSLPMSFKHQGFNVGNCTETDDPNCSLFEGIPMAARVPYPSKAFPAFGHPPPGTHVMPAPPIMSKMQMPAMNGKQYSPSYAPHVTYFDEERDVLTEHEYLELLKAQNISESDSNDTKEESETLQNSPEATDRGSEQEYPEENSYNNKEIHDRHESDRNDNKKASVVNKDNIEAAVSTESTTYVTDTSAEASTESSIEASTEAP